MLVAFFSFAKGDYAVTSPAVVEGRIQRSLVAPFKSYLAAEYVRAGAGLSKATFANMSRAQVQLAGKPGESMGLGWEVMRGPLEDSTILLHTGADAGIRTLIILLPASQRGLVLFTNGERGMDVIMKILKATLRMKELTP